VKQGDAPTVKVTFPDDYGRAEISGKPAEFDVKVNSVKYAESVAIDDKLANAVGVENLAALNEAIHTQLKGEHARASRNHLK
ncbi:MAG: trigger factor, partial [Alphaproteobacteria bacterium]